MITNKRVISTTVLSMSLLAPFTAATAQSLLDTISSLNDNQWSLLSTNKFSDAWPDPNQYRVQGAPDGLLVGSPNAVIPAWSSFAWDSKRDQIILSGGGHANYAGNEVYLWDGNSGAWGRGSLPSEIKWSSASNDAVAYDGSDNAPVSSHTYDNNLYLPIADRFAFFGGGTYGQGGGHFKDEDGNRTGPYFWDPGKADASKVGGTDGSHIRPDMFPNVQGGEMWENRYNPIPYFGGHTNGATAYAEEDGKDVAYVDTVHFLWKYTVNDVNDASMDTWEKVGDSNIPLGGNWSQGPGAMDAEEELFVRIGTPNQGNRFIYYDLSESDQSNPALAQVFDPEIIGGTLNTDLKFAGMDYDPIRDRFVIWDEEGQLWELTSPETLGTTGWELYLLEVEEGLLPNPDATRGILGKWEYIPEYDIFLGLYGASDGEVWAYKPENWTPTVPIPAAGWLFGSALLGLVGMSRRRKRA